MTGRKNNIKQFQSIVSGDMSQTSITSAITDIQFLDDVGIEFSWTGSPVGVFSIEVSASYSQDFNGNVLNAGHWTPVVFTYYDGVGFNTGSSVPTSLGSPIYIDLALLSAPYIRVVYTKTSGTGTLQTYLTAKAV